MAASEGPNAYMRGSGVQRAVRGKSGNPAFLIEVVPGDVGDAAQAAVLRGRQPITPDQLVDLEEVGTAIVQTCQQVVERVSSGLAQACSDELELTFGVSLSAEGGIALITKASGEATFEVRAMWNFGDRQRDD
jgi:hypothetical protein